MVDDRQLQGVLSFRHATDASTASRGKAGALNRQLKVVPAALIESMMMSRSWADTLPTTITVPPATALVRDEASWNARTRAKRRVVGRMFSPVLFDERRLRGIDDHRDGLVTVPIIIHESDAMGSDRQRGCERGSTEADRLATIDQEAIRPGLRSQRDGARGVRGAHAAGGNGA